MTLDLVQTGDRETSKGVAVKEDIKIAKEAQIYLSECQG